MNYGILSTHKLLRCPDCSIRLLLYARNLKLLLRSFLLAGSRRPPLAEGATTLKRQVECKRGRKGSFIRCETPHNELNIMEDQCLGGRVPTLKVIMIKVLLMVVEFGELYLTLKSSSVINALKKTQALIGWLASPIPGREGMREGAVCRTPAKQLRTITHPSNRKTDADVKIFTTYSNPARGIVSDFARDLGRLRQCSDNWLVIRKLNPSVSYFPQHELRCQKTPSPCIKFIVRYSLFQYYTPHL